MKKVCILKWKCRLFLDKDENRMWLSLDQIILIFS